MPETEGLSTEPGEQPKRPTSGRTKRAARRKKNSPSRGKHRGRGLTTTLNFPKHRISRCLRIPQAVLDQNAGNPCADKEATKFAGMAYTGPLGVEISSGIKYGLLEVIS